MRTTALFLCCLVTMSIGSVSSFDPLELITTALFSDCTTIRSWLGLTYGQMVNTPAEPNVTKVNLYLYTQSSTTSRSLVGGANALLQDPGFDKTLPVTIYCHGWLEPPGDDSITTVTNALKAKGGQNVLHLDSYALIGNLYLYSSTALQFIGNALGTELNILAQNGVLPENIHVIGFSMGAHISGFTGKRFKALTGSLLGHITGLDPAGPCFYNNDATLRLNSGDATFVDIIHTNTGAWGTVTPHGHVDFYPNSGDYQPLCILPSCNHKRAWQYYSESILSNQAFPALKCNSWWTYLIGFCQFNAKAYMGYAVDRSTRGVYYLKTNGCPPYGNVNTTSSSS
nr:pancreatic lipase-like D [Limnephilus flavicornis]